MKAINYAGFKPEEKATKQLYQHYKRSICHKYVLRCGKLTISEVTK